jgi:multidrug efflux pump subunit AcrA (membrane-fusion protein)
MTEVDVVNTEERPIWKRRRVQIGAAALLVLIVAGWCWHRRGAAPAADTAQPIVSVRVAKAEIGPITQPLDLVGTISARQQATLSPKVSAQIAQMGLLKNRVVHRGDVLAVLESRDLNAQQAEAAAALHEAQIGVTNTGQGAIPLTNAQDVKAVRDAQGTLDNARKTYERRKTLFEQGGISKKDLEVSQLDLAKAGSRRNRRRCTRARPILPTSPPRRAKRSRPPIILPPSRRRRAMPPSAHRSTASSATSFSFRATSPAPARRC